MHRLVAVLPDQPAQGGFMATKMMEPRLDVTTPTVENVLAFRTTVGEG